MKRTITMEQAIKHYETTENNGIHVKDVKETSNSIKKVFKREDFEISYYFIREQLVKIEVWDEFSLIELFVR